QSIYVLPPTELDDRIGATDRIGTPVHDIGCGYAASQLSVNIKITWIQNVSNGSHGRDIESELINGVGGNMGMAIDDARDYELPPGVNDFSTLRSRNIGSDGSYFSVSDQNR